MKDINGIEVIDSVAYIGPRQEIMVKHFNWNRENKARGITELHQMRVDYAKLAQNLCFKAMEKLCSINSSCPCRNSSMLLGKASYSLRQADSIGRFIDAHLKMGGR